jgi:hypothetical protein
MSFSYSLLLPISICVDGALPERTTWKILARIDLTSVNAGHLHSTFTSKESLLRLIYPVLVNMHIPNG